jgi:DNA-directed RNA polymerase specialized sigma24 family protein
MKNALSLSQEGFDQLLSWLDPDRDQAGNKYEAIRRRLIKLFVCRGSDDPEGLADLTFDRVVSKVETIKEGYSGDPALYFYGVANNIFREELRRTVVPTELSPNLPVVAPEKENSYSDQEFGCLEMCLGTLKPDARDLILSYYKESSSARIGMRKQFADKIGIPVSTLRLRVHRIRAALQQCAHDCVQRNNN